MTLALKLHQVEKTFRTRTGTVHAVQGVSITIEPGEVVALLGENGAGKTTLLDMVLGLSTPTSGTLELGGVSPSEAVRGGRVGAVLQTGGLLKDLTVHDQIAMIAATHGCPERTPEVLEAAGLTDISNRKISKCSGGQQQKIKFALALLAHPAFLVLDEPTAGMDVNARGSFWEAMHALAARGTTILFATHYLEEAENFADRVLLMAGGRLIADGPTEHIRSALGGRHISFETSTTNLNDVLPITEQERWGLKELSQAGQTVSFYCAAAEDFLAGFLPHHRVSNLEVTRPSLADAFSHLTHTNR